MLPNPLHLAELNHGCICVLCVCTHMHVFTDDTVQRGAKYWRSYHMQKQVQGQEKWSWTKKSLLYSTPSVSLWVMTVSPIVIGRSQRRGGKTLHGVRGLGSAPTLPPPSYVTLIFPLAMLEVWTEQMSLFSSPIQIPNILTVLERSNSGTG